MTTMTAAKRQSNVVPIISSAVTLDDIMVSMKLCGQPVGLEQIPAKHEELCSILASNIRRMCKTSLLSGNVTNHSRDHIYDDAVKGVAAQISIALLYGRSDEAELLFHRAAADVFSTEQEIRKHVIPATPQGR